MARAGAAARGDRALPPPRAPDEDLARRRPQQLPDQPRRGGSGPAEEVDRGARRRAGQSGVARPGRPRHAPGLVHLGHGRWRAETDRRRARRASSHRVPRRRPASCWSTPRGRARTSGHRFEHLAAIIDLLGGSPRVGVCLDTCHLLAAGYDICSVEGYTETFRQFGKIVGFSRLKAFHLNDSKKPCASRVDRHEHIGKGCIGLAPFRRLLNDPRFAKLPMLLETPKVDTPQTRKASDVDPLGQDEPGRPARTASRRVQSPKTSAAKR